MTTDPLDRLADSDAPARPAPGTADSLRRRLDLQRRMTSGAPDTTQLILYLAVDNAARAIEFYASVFRAALRGEPIETR